ncbi:MAG: TetR/AcrR family transcriptional regulator [Desulfobacterales bacterium]|nr:TetR/AcrR family transcriptional regulator [Desulfobacterales bacterium]
MKRISKKPDERKEEIILASQDLFIKKGYIKTKVSDIVRQINVSQGTFYYYFKSKEEVVNAIVDLYIKDLVDSALPVINNTKLTALEKLEMMSNSQLEINLKKNKDIHGIKGVDIHEKVIAQIVEKYVPLIVEAYKLGQEEGVFKVKRNIHELTEFFVVAANILFDPGIFQWKDAEKQKRLSFIIEYMEKCYKAPKGSFDFYRRLMNSAEKLS